MTSKMSKQSFEKLIREDIVCLKKHMPDNLERKHIIITLEQSVALNYPEKTKEIIMLSLRYCALCNHYVGHKCKVEATKEKTPTVLLCNLDNNTTNLHDTCTKFSLKNSLRESFNKGQPKPRLIIEKKQHHVIHFLNLEERCDECNYRKIIIENSSFDIEDGREEWNTIRKYLTDNGDTFICPRCKKEKKYCIVTNHKIV